MSYLFPSPAPRLRSRLDYFSGQRASAGLEKLRLRFGQFLPQFGQFHLGPFDLFSGPLCELLCLFAAALGLARVLAQHVQFGFGRRHPNAEHLHFPDEALWTFSVMHASSLVKNSMVDFPFLAHSLRKIVA